MHPEFLPARTSPLFFGAVALVAASLCAFSLGASIRAADAAHASAKHPAPVIPLDERSLAEVSVSSEHGPGPHDAWRVSATSNRFESLRGGSVFVTNGVVEILAQTDSSATLAVDGRPVRISNIKTRGNEIALQFNAGELAATEHMVMRMNDRHAWNAKPVRIATKLVAAIVAANARVPSEPHSSP